MTTSLADRPVVTSSILRIGHYALAAEVLLSTWIIDLDASYRMHNRNEFTTYERLPNPIRIQLGNKTYVLATHDGSL